MFGLFFYDCSVQGLENFCFDICKVWYFVKTVFTFSLPWRHRGGVEVQLHSFFNLGTRWRWLVNATPWPLYRREWPGAHSIGGWVGPRVALDGCGKSRPHRDSIPLPSSYSDWAIPAHKCDTYEKYIDMVLVTYKSMPCNLWHSTNTSTS